MSLNYAITHIQVCSPLQRRSTDICRRSSSFYTWPRPTLFLKPTILFWSNYGRVDLSRTGRKRNIGIPNNTHTHTQFTRGHQFWKWIKPAQKQINKSWLKWASASLPKTLNAWNLNHVSWCYDSIDIYSKLTVMPYVVLYCCNAVNLTAK